MKHFTTPDFWKCYEKLFAHIKELADKNFALLKDDPRHPYETNISNPPINNLLAIANALGVSILEILGQSKGKNTDMFEDIDMRTLKKIMQIKKLSKKDRLTIYNTIDAML